MLRPLLFVILVLAITNANTQTAVTPIISQSEKDLIPEGIAVDSRNGNIYISSIAKQKIIVIDAKGKHKDFIATNEHGFLEGLGMKVDTKRNLLWAISVKTAPKSYTSQVHAFDLTSGRKEQFYALSDSVPHMFNDLDIDKEGNVYITDTYHSAIYHINTETQQLQLFLKAQEIQYPNGIAIADNNKLYIATYQNGPAKIDLATKTATLLKGYADSVVARGLDGLVYYNNSLIGIYNYSLTKRGFDTALVVKYVLNKEGNKIIKEEIIDKGNPLFFQPTTLSVSNKELFVLANSHLAIYNANKQSTKGKGNELTPVAITRYNIAE